MSSTGSERPFRADVEMADEFAVTRAEITPPRPVEARWAMGSKKPSDVIWTTLGVPVLISERVVRLLRESGFRGWATYEINLVGHDRVRIPGYYGLSIHGRCGPIDNSRCVEVPKQYPAGVFPVWKGMYFDPDTWDGCDIFVPAGRVGFMFVVDEVKCALEKAKVKNLCFTALDEVERSML